MLCLAINHFSNTAEVFWGVLDWLCPNSPFETSTRNVMDFVCHENYCESTAIFVAQKRKRTGRPKLPKGKAKTHIVRTRVTPDEHRAMQEIAKAAGKDPSEWLRDVIVSFLRDPNREALVREMIAEDERKQRRGST